MFPLPVRQYSHVSPPHPLSPTGSGQELAFAVGPAQTKQVNLTVVGGQPASLYNASSAQTSNQQGPGVTGSYVTIFADGNDIGVIVGVSKDAVSAISLSTLGSISGSGTYQGVTGACHRIPAGNERRYLMQAGYDQWLGVVDANSGVTGTVRVYQSSPAIV